MSVEGDSNLRHYNFKTNDNKISFISERELQHSILLRNLAASSTQTNKAIPLPLADVSSKTLDIVFQWCRAHKDDPIRDDAQCFLAAPISSTDELFFANFVFNEVRDIMHAARELQINALSRVASQIAARMAKLASKAHNNNK